MRTDQCSSCEVFSSKSADNTKHRSDYIPAFADNKECSSGDAKTEKEIS